MAAIKKTDEIQSIIFLQQQADNLNNPKRKALLFSLILSTYQENFLYVRKPFCYRTKFINIKKAKKLLKQMQSAEQLHIDNEKAAEEIQQIIKKNPLIGISNHNSLPDSFQEEPPKNPEKVLKNALIHRTAHNPV